ncbi:hypothetical protein MSAN_01359100 [Mycena sanguinolenta]|uniref:Uncharacterized protein n=1 Tax=Mycena sanguinolenta TaxID=230812 RepID=A0A8H7D3H3_9AGAR|nr:hypothetical protein MSAN_01359100 [Mycena sanguinolenta]
MSERWGKAKVVASSSGFNYGSGRDLDKQGSCHSLQMMGREMPSPYNWRERPADYPALCEKLAPLQSEALCKPLRAGLRFGLDLKICAPCTLAGGRGLPTIFPAGSPLSSSTVTLELDGALQSGLDGDSDSQVWTAKVVNVPSTHLVMKIIQPSLCFRPDPSDPHWFHAYDDPYDLAHNEAWVYQQLARLQGHSIPYFFGVFEITTPSDEIAWTLVLEYVPGPTMQTIAKISPASVNHFCELGLKAVQGLALSGWALGDICSATNYIFNSSSEDPVVVMVDLYDTVYIPDLQPPPSFERVACTSAKRFFHTFKSSVRDRCPSFFDWAKQNLPREVWDLYFPDSPDGESEDDGDGRKQENESDKL